MLDGSGAVGFYSYWPRWYLSGSVLQIAYLDTKGILTSSFSRERDTEMDKPLFLLMNVKRSSRHLIVWVDSEWKMWVDFYDKNDRFTVTNKERNEYNSFVNKLDPWEKSVWTCCKRRQKRIYVFGLSQIKAVWFSHADYS